MMKKWKLLNKYKNVFIYKEFKHLNEVDYNTSNFCRLPKIRKSQIITNDIKQQYSKVVNIKKPRALKLKPIIEGPKFPSEKVVSLLTFS